MTHRLQKRALKIVGQAVRLSGPQRAALLHQACAHNPLLRREVVTLLSHFGNPGRFLGLNSSISNRKFGHFRIYEQIAAGSEGPVYRCRDIALGRWVALKTLHPWAIGHPAFRKLILRGARLAARVNHPNVVTIYEVGKANGQDYLAMELVEGQTLGASIPPGGLPLSEVLRYAIQMVNGLLAVHRAGVVHGDVKPANMMITLDGQVKLMDFGQALFWQDRSPLKPRFRTLAYSAPELRHRGACPTIGGDIFSVGLVLFEMLTGNHAFGLQGGNRDLPVAPDRLPESVPQSVAGIVQRCLRRKPRNRYRSMRELLTALQQAAKVLGEPAECVQRMRSPYFTLFSPK